jgi:hypothetical protein
MRLQPSAMTQRAQTKATEVAECTLPGAAGQTMRRNQWSCGWRVSGSCSERLVINGAKAYMFGAVACSRLLASAAAASRISPQLSATLARPAAAAASQTRAVASSMARRDNSHVDCNEAAWVCGGSVSWSKKMVWSRKRFQ